MTLAPETPEQAPHIPEEAINPETQPVTEVLNHQEAAEQETGYVPTTSLAAGEHTEPQRAHGWRRIAIIGGVVAGALGLVGGGIAAGVSIAKPAAQEQTLDDEKTNDQTVAEQGQGTDDSTDETVVDEPVIEKPVVDEPVAEQESTTPEAQTIMNLSFEQYQEMKDMSIEDFAALPLDMRFMYASQWLRDQGLYDPRLLFNADDFLNQFNGSPVPAIENFTTRVEYFESMADEHPSDYPKIRYALFVNPDENADWIAQRSWERLVLFDDLTVTDPNGTVENKFGLPAEEIDGNSFITRTQQYSDATGKLIQVKRHFVEGTYTTEDGETISVSSWVWGKVEPVNP